MNFVVVNKDIQVHNIKITGVGTSSILLVGDTNEIKCSSVFDTPPEAVTEFAPTIPFAPEVGAARGAT